MIALSSIFPYFSINELHFVFLLKKIYLSFAPSLPRLRQHVMHLMFLNIKVH